MQRKLSLSHAGLIYDADPVSFLADEIYVVLAFLSGQVIAEKLCLMPDET